jgi:hypothetical protein
MLCAATLATLGYAAPARAQNTGPFYYSEDAAKVAGAVVARPGDSAAIHYNPAGLASITRGRVSANGSVFGLRVRNFDDAFQTTFGGVDEQLDLRATDVVSAPNALSASFHLGSVTLSAGLFVTERDVRQASDDLVDAPVPDFPGGLYTKRVEIQRDLTKYHLGTGLGFELAKGVRLGAAVFATYRTAASIAQYALGGTLDGGSLYENLSYNSVETRVGFFGTVGLQADVSDRVHLGLVVRSPEVILHSSDTGGGIYSYANTLPGAADSEFYLLESTGLRAGGTLAVPLSFTLGAMVQPTDALELSAEADLYTGLDNPELALDRQLTVNGRVGVRGRVSKEVVLGGGLFTDLSPATELGAFFTDERVDWFGGTLGITLLTPLALASRPDDEEGIVLSTTLAVRYALGTGQARAFLFGDLEDETPAVDVVYHEVVPFFGSSILF